MPVEVTEIGRDRKSIFYSDLWQLLGSTFDRDSASSRKTLVSKALPIPSQNPPIRVNNP